MRIFLLAVLLCGVGFAQVGNDTDRSEAFEDASPLRDGAFLALQRKEQYFDAYLDEYTDNATRNTAFQMAGSIFNIDPYKSNYLLPMTHDFVMHDDRQRTEVAFQLSLKKDILYDFLGFKETLSLAYTQRSWWQLYKHSSPFRETNYLPEIYVSIPWYNNKSPIKNYKFGFLHESNGQSESSSRSWNRLYLDVMLQYKGFFINPRVWYRVYENPDDDDNHDILDYMGYGDLTLIYPYKEHVFKLLLRNNFDFSDNRGAVQADWTFSLWQNGLFGYVQYFDGYGESLIDYNRRTRRLGLGFSFSR
ncbi:MAG: phospholipase A [Campylobacteraceae bacterium]|jgi:phospholipase A1|nr:phospholipase A [Campylobacteraceae bacterium]